jgi:hypothetical protein
MSLRRFLIVQSQRLQTSRFLTSKSDTVDWRKKQLDRLENRFQNVESDEDLQPMWKSMESRVKSRRPRTLEERGGLSGRSNVKRTDEDCWLQGGLYEYEEDETNKK